MIIFTYLIGILTDFWILPIISQGFSLNTEESEEKNEDEDDEKEAEEDDAEE